MYYNFIYPDIRVNPDYRFDEVMSGYNYNFSIVNNWQYSGATIGGVVLSGGSVIANTISATTYLGLPSSNFTGGTITGPTTFTAGLTTNSISATTYLGLPSSNFTGGTITGPTTFTNGLTATSISATTYLGLPTDIRVTGGTYSAGTATFRNNTGGTFSVTGFTNPFTGGTVTGATTFTNGLTATSISATTYYGLPSTSGLYLPLSGGSVVGNTNITGVFRITGNTTTYGNLTSLGATSSYTATPLTINPGTYTTFLQKYYLKIHPESSNNFIPYFINDIGYLTLRGGSVTSDYTGITQTQIETIFDGSPKYASFNPSLLGTGMTLNISFGENFNFTNALAISFGATNWRAQDFIVELVSGGTYSTLDIVTGYTESDYLIEFSLPSLNTFNGLRVTFSNFFNTSSPTGFRIADISLISFNSNGPKSLYVGRDGGEIYKQIQITGGTTTTPSYSTLNDTNTGIYFPASDTVGFVTNGTEKLRIDSLGNVGIGIAVPSANLHINNTTTGTTFLAEDDTNPDSSPFIIDASGNVGIGTKIIQTGGTKLHISGNSKVLALEGTNHVYQEFYPQGLSSGRFGYFGYPSSGSTILRIFNEVSGGTLSFGTSGTIRVTIDSSGNTIFNNRVGIGTSTPTQSLDINSTIRSRVTNGSLLIGGGETTISGSPLGDGFRFRYEPDLFGSSFDGLVFEKTDFNNNTPDGGIMFANVGSGGTRVAAMSIRGTGNVGIGTANPITKLHVSGDTTFTGGLTATSISATTYLGLPTDIRVTGGTYSAGTATFTNNTGGTFSVTGFSTATTFTGGTVNGPTIFTNGLTATSISATTYYNLPISPNNFLPLSGGTVTGGTIFQSGVTANTISQVDYIDFNVNPIVSNPTGGTLYFDATENALSYKPITDQNDVTINIGQESLIRIFNNTGTQINNGQALHVTGATSGSPTVSLANGAGGNQVQFQVSGIATHDIPNLSYGFMTFFGIVRDINLTAFTIGEQIYLSQTTPGGFAKYSDLSFTGRTCEIGHVIDNSTLGKLQVSILNEIEGTIITTQENNILAANNSSTGVFQFSGLTIDTPSGTTFSVGAAQGWIIDNVTSPTNPNIQLITYPGSIGNPSLYYSSATETYILLTSASTITQQTTFPSPQQRRQNLYLGKFGHGTRQFLINAFNEPDSALSPLSQLRDMFTAVKLINDGVIASANGVNLNFNTSAGILYGLGIGYVTNKLNPNSLTVSGQSPTTFQYRTQTGGTALNTTLIDPLNYDLNGVKTALAGTKATNQRIYLLQNGQIRVQYGQTVYNQLSAAVAALQNETFVTFPNFRDNGILIGILSVLSSCTDLTDTSKAQFFSVSKFGELIGAAGGTSTTTLQQAYNNSSQPEIVTNSSLGGLTIQNGTGSADSVTNNIEFKNTAGNTTSFIRADGYISGSTIQTGGVILNSNGLTATSTLTSQGAFGNVKVDAGSSQSMIVFSGSGTVGGTGYTDFIKVTNTAVGATNINKTFRVNNTGGLEIVNSAYSALTLSLSDSGNLIVGGTVTPQAWTAGQVIKDTILSNTDVTVSTTTIGTSGSDTDFITYSYTPVSSNSYLIIHYHLAKYDATAGTGNDSWFSRIKVDGGEITFSWQTTVNGFRSGALFPLTGRYTNSSTTAKSIVVACRRDSADDSITITNSSTSMWLRITEIAR